MSAVTGLGTAGSSALGHSLRSAQPPGVKVVGGKLEASGRRGPPLAYVKGVDGLPAESKTCPKGKRPELNDVWSTNGKVTVDQDGVDTIAIDFSEKTDGKVGLLVGKHDPAC